MRQVELLFVEHLRKGVEAAALVPMNKTTKNAKHFMLPILLLVLMGWREDASPELKVVDTFCT
jgi:TRAP-type uncharacterized transport system fused permease subunit